MTRKLLIAFAASSLLAVLPAGALAAGPYWAYFKKPKVVRIAEATAVPVATSGTLAVVSEGEKMACKAAGRDVIENPAGEGVGIDSMTSFKANCSGHALYPCVVGENSSLVGPPTVPSWVSGLGELGGFFVDTFPGVTVEVRCVKSKKTAIYSGTLFPQLTPSKLTFTTTSGTLSSGPHSFVLNGTLTLKASGYKELQAVE